MRVFLWVKCRYLSQKVSGFWYDGVVAKRKTKKIKKVSGEEAISLSWYLILSGLVNIVFILQSFVQVLRDGAEIYSGGGVRESVEVVESVASLEWLFPAYVGIGGLVGVFLFQMVYGWYLRNMSVGKSRVPRNYVMFGWALGTLSTVYLLRFLSGFMSINGWM